MNQTDLKANGQWEALLDLRLIEHRQRHQIEVFNVDECQVQVLQLEKSLILQRKLLNSFETGDFSTFWSLFVRFDSTQERVVEWEDVLT